MSERVDFFEVVKLTDAAALKNARGKNGYIAGVSEEDGRVFGYGVWVYDLEEVWSVDCDQFVLLGYQDEIAKAEHARRPSIRVSPNGEIL